MKKFVIQFLLLIIVIFVALMFYTGRIPTSPFLPEPTRRAEVVVNDVKLKVEIADNQQKRSKGLGGREKLASDEGMLFIFEKEDKYPFWMKGLNFPLDFVWIKGDKVVDILPNVPQPTEGQKAETLPIYQSKVAVDKVLEVNAGTVVRLNIKVGDTIRIES